MKGFISNVHCEHCLCQMILVPNKEKDRVDLACSVPECVGRGKRYIAPRVELEPSS